MGCIALVRCVLVLRCGLPGVVWYPDAGFSLHTDTTYIIEMKIKSLKEISSKFKLQAYTRKVPGSRCSV